RSVDNRFKAAGVGLAVTALLQSSTATVLILSSFAGRGLIATAPALAVMLGADVGTTLVAQALSFKVGWLAPVLLVIGVAAHLSARRTLTRQVARAIIGLGLILLSLKLILAATAPLTDTHLLREALEALEGEPVLALLMAALLTWLAHSSLAVVLMVMSMAAGGVVSLGLAALLVLGANLGGVLPAIIATLASGPEGKRVAWGNALFKLAGVLVVLPLLHHAVAAVALLDAEPARLVVNLHTAFNLSVAVAFLFLTGPVAGLTEKLLPTRPAADDGGAPRYLDADVQSMPALALANAERETLHMGDLVESMLDRALAAIRDGDREAEREIAALDDDVDRLHEQIQMYVTEISREDLEPEESRRLTQILAFTTNLEHIGDIVDVNLMELASKRRRHAIRLSDGDLDDVVALLGRVQENLRLALGVFLSGDLEGARRLMKAKRQVSEQERASAEGHLNHLSADNPESLAAAGLYLDLLRDVKRIHSHTAAVAYPVLDAAGELRKTRLRKPKRTADHGNGDVAAEPV
ncbi:MAG: Na/Pi cotransporter family protein, partial [Rhodobacterales bacterium]|nr:Na/Pi cotransporter family protein [Rhodobacterales bacterium]